MPKIDYLADYPRSLLNDLQTGRVAESEIPVAEITFSIEPPDRDVLSPNFTLAPDATITLTRYLNDSRTYSLTGFEKPGTFGAFRQDLTRLRAHVAKQEDSEAGVALLDVQLAHADNVTIVGDRADSPASLNLSSVRSGPSWSRRVGSPSSCRLGSVVVSTPSPMSTVTLQLAATPAGPTIRVRCWSRPW